MARRLSIYLPAAAEAAMQPCDDSVSGRISSILIRYAGIVRDECPAFHIAEWSAICDVLNGTWLQAEHTEIDPARHMWAEMADAPEMGAKLAIDHPALVQRLRALTYAQRVSVVEIATRFWRSPKLNELSTAELLAEAGARIRTRAHEIVEQHRTAAAVMEAMAAAGVEGDQDWDAESTTYHLPDGSRIIVSGPSVDVA